MIQAYADIAAPLTELTKKQIDCIWQTACTSALDTLKMASKIAAMSVIPNPDSPFQLITDSWLRLWDKSHARKQAVVFYSEKILHLNIP